VRPRVPLLSISVPPKPLCWLDRLAPNHNGRGFRRTSVTYAGCVASGSTIVLSGAVQPQPVNLWRPVEPRRASPIDSGPRCELNSIHTEATVRGSECSLHGGEPRPRVQGQLAGRPQCEPLEEMQPVHGGGVRGTARACGGGSSRPRLLVRGGSTPQRRRSSWGLPAGPRGAPRRRNGPLSVPETALIRGPAAVREGLGAPKPAPVRARLLCARRGCSAAPGRAHSAALATRTDGAGRPEKRPMLVRLLCARRGSAPSETALVQALSGVREAAPACQCRPSSGPACGPRAARRLSAFVGGLPARERGSAPRKRVLAGWSLWCGRGLGAPQTAIVEDRGRRSGVWARASGTRETIGFGSLAAACSALRTAHRTAECAGHHLSKTGLGDLSYDLS
jgi:hypothetical protein